ncbi:hypothetical protein R9C00_21125 [Flammeovirgaceae bacterium SG7u.111]|nr:hypothetical protein [Flammeovirgaceae bacterium SG7u.132]WPO34205.1 hypothetical protein R9C00_21125 [Flammeovirgaceae bacterium SG7u.111]
MKPYVIIVLMICSSCQLLKAQPENFSIEDTAFFKQKGWINFVTNKSELTGSFNSEFFEKGNQLELTDSNTFRYFSIKQRVWDGYKSKLLQEGSQYFIDGELILESSKDIFKIYLPIKYRNSIFLVPPKNIGSFLKRVYDAQKTDDFEESLLSYEKLRAAFLHK